MSPMEPPATERKALPARPSKKRETSIVPMFFATAKPENIISQAYSLKEKMDLPQGISQIVKKTYAPMYTGRLP